MEPTSSPDSSLNKDLIETQDYLKNLTIDEITTLMQTVGDAFDFDPKEDKLAALNGTKLAIAVVALEALFPLDLKLAVKLGIACAVMADLEKGSSNPTPKNETPTL